MSKEVLAKARNQAHKKLEFYREVVAAESKKPSKSEKRGAKKIVSALNDFLSVLNEVGNDEGFTISDLHRNSLFDLHREMIKIIS